MKTRIAGGVAGIALAVSIFAGGSGLAHADVVLSTTTKGGETCTTYQDEHGHIYEVCHAPVAPLPATSLGVEAQPDQAAQEIDWVQSKGLNWPIIIRH
jgi:hypothetical protein